MNRIASVAALALTASAAPKLGGCDKSYQPMATFDIEKYAGTWYEIVRDKYTPFEILAGCTMAEYTINDDGTLGVYNTSHRFGFGWTGGRATAVVADTGDASLIVDFTGKVPSPSDTPNYTVLDTDYETYTVVHSCSDILGGLASWDAFWILARENTLDDTQMLDIIDIVEEKLPSYGFFKNTLNTRQGKTCPYKKRPE